MINSALVMEKFALLTGLPPEEAEKWRSLTEGALQHLEGLIAPGADTAENVGPLAAAAAAEAYYGYCLAQSSREDAAITAGTVTVKNDHKAKLAAAAALREQAYLAVTRLLRDTGFVFLRA